MGAQKNIETVYLSTNNLCIGSEIRNYTLLHISLDLHIVQLSDIKVKLFLLVDLPDFISD